ncbi:MAG: 30S ribosomal protein S1 [Alicyclobacillus sp.]|nr:30S ribosomal protein S1 [Alicyclobacillus sp.]
MSEDMNEMLTASSLTPGTIVKGTVKAVDDKKVTVDIGHPLEGIIPIRELSALHVNHPSEVVSEGDEVRAAVLKLDEEAGVIVLSKREADAEGAWDALKDKYERGEVFEVTVHDVVKGGLVTDVGVRGFIPASLIDTHFVDDLSSFKGQTLRVKVSEIDPQNNKLILSRKAVLEEEQRQQALQALSQIQPGAILEGTVQRLASFGAFVDIGGVDGLVHVSEMAWHHVKSPEEAVKIGDRVRVKVLKVDPESGKISLSMKQAQPSPWTTAAQDFHPGDVVEGVVRRVVDFGAFVELKPGLEGLVHVSQISNEHVARADDVLEPGQQVKVKVLSVEPDRRRISLSMRDAERGGGRPTERREPQRFTEKLSNNNGTGATLGDIFGDLFKR